MQWPQRVRIYLLLGVHDQCYCTFDNGNKTCSFIFPHFYNWALLCMVIWKSCLRKPFCFCPKIQISFPRKQKWPMPFARRDLRCSGTKKSTSKVSWLVSTCCFFLSPVNFVHKVAQIKRLSETSYKATSPTYSEKYATVYDSTYLT